MQRANLTPNLLSPADVATLQRTIGNRAVGQLDLSIDLQQTVAAGVAQDSLQTIVGNSAILARHAPGQLQQPVIGPLVQRDITEDIQNLQDDMATIDDELLQNIIAEVLEMRELPNLAIDYGPSPKQSHVKPEGENTGQDRPYDVIIDETIFTDQLKRQSIILHELMHVSADQKYEINKLDPLKGTIQNLLYPGDLERGSQAHEKFLLDQSEIMWQHLDELKQFIYEEENILGKQLSDYLLERLGRAYDTEQEFDTVMSELLYYVSKRNVDPDTKTYKKIRSLAKAAYKRRHEKVPIQAPIEEEGPETASPNRKKGCFITTACVEARGLADDCDELTTLRTFRDNYMCALPDGNALILEYYDIAPQIVASIKAQPEAATILSDLYERIIESVRLVKAGENEAALRTYATVVLDLKGKYLST